MKFLKEDGTIEDGQPLSVEQVTLRETLEEYLHQVVCKNAYHARYEGVRGCLTAANFLTIKIAEMSLPDCIKAIGDAVQDIKPKHVPEPRQPLTFDVEEAKPAISKEDDEPL